MRRDLEENVKKLASLKAEYDKICIENTEINKRKFPKRFGFGLVSTVKNRGLSSLTVFNFF